VPWGIEGKWRWETSFCGGTNNAKGSKGGKSCYVGRIAIHRNVVECTSSHKGAGNDRSTMKVDGNGIAWSRNGSEKKMHNPG